MNGKNFQRYLLDTYGKAEKIVFDAARNIKKRLGLPLPKRMKDVDRHEIVNVDEVKEKLTQLLPHKWEDKYQFAVAYAREHQSAITNKI